MTQTYFPYAFGVDADDLTAIPFETDPNGSVSFQEGFTSRYQLKLRVNPAALPFPRGQFNQLMLYITQNQQSLMQYGIVFWVSPEENLGVPLAYPINAVVRHNDIIYRNTIEGNITEPGTDDTWVIGADTTSVGSSIIWNSIDDPIGRWLEEDGSEINRADYAALYNVLCPIKTGNTTNTSDIITGLTNANRIKVGTKVEGIGIPSGAYVIANPNDVSVQISAAATATATGIDIRFFTWGNGDGTTTFNLPNKQSHYLSFAGGTGISYNSNTYNKTGQTLGASTYTLVLNNLPEHTHSAADNHTFMNKGGATGEGFDGGTNQFGESNHTGGIVGGTTNDPIPTVPPGVMVRSFIRY